MIIIFYILEKQVFVDFFFINDENVMEEQELDIYLLINDIVNDIKCNSCDIII